MFFYNEPTDIQHVASTFTLIVNSASLTFPNTYITSPSQKTFSVRAVGNTSRTISVSRSGTTQYTCTPATFALTGGVGEQLVTVNFAPTSLGVKNGAITISGSDDGPKNVSLTGTCINTQVLTASHPYIEFQTYVNQTGTYPVFISAGAGQSTETITVSDDSNRFSFSPSSFTLAGGSYATVNITYSPKAVIFAEYGNIYFISSNGSRAQIGVTGRSSNAPLRIVPAVSNINFGTVKTGTTKTITLNLSIIGTGTEVVRIYKGDGNFYLDNDPSTTGFHSINITGGTTYPLKVTFRPYSYIGVERIDVLDIISNEFSNAHDYINLRGLESP